MSRHPEARLHLFEGLGIEIEWMIVDRETLAVRPITDRLLAAVAGTIVSEVERGPLAWSNELVLHVVELKTNGPATAVDEALLAAFEADARHIDALLRPHGARLLGSAMHPTMDPLAETVLWPHGYNAVYRAYDQIFDCQGHGWSNLQSLHLNFPFATDHRPDSEFGRLHAAIRLLLPILPALCASSPLADGKADGRAGATLDQRMAYYRTNSARVPSLTGQVVPEPVFDRAAYQRQIFDRMDRDIAPLDTGGVLVGQPFLNARGAIARFDRGAIEIRVIDVQECPRADLAVAALCRAVLKALVAERWTGLARQQAWPTEPLAALLQRVVQDGERTVIEDPDYLAALGLDRARATAGELWRHLLDAAIAARDLTEPWESTLDTMIEQGPLARRILRALGPEPSTEDLRTVYRTLADCLVDGRLFLS